VNQSRELSESQGRPASALKSTLGPLSTARGSVALFGSGEIVACLLRFRRRPRLFVFRTLTVDDRLAASIPGVRPRVQLLLQLRTRGRIGRARDLFAYLARTERDPSALADDFYVRAGIVLVGRLSQQISLGALLRLARQTDPSPTGDPAKPL